MLRHYIVDRGVASAAPLHHSDVPSEGTPARPEVDPMRALTILLLLASAPSASAQELPAHEPARRPNVLVLLADDLSWHDLGFAGGVNVPTPRLDALRAEGLWLRGASSMTAMCTPARTQLYTGLGPVRSGAFPNHSAVRTGVQGLPQHFAPLGYRVALLGKRHVKPRASFEFEALGGAGQLHGAQLGDTLRAFFADCGDEPWFLVVASSEPHYSWERGAELRPAPEALVVPPYLVDTPATRAALSRYYGEVAYLDRQLGVCLDELARTSVADDTLVVFLSEQGAGLPFAKWTCYEAGLRSSALVRWPGHVAADSSSDALVQYVDFLPTWLAAAGASTPDGLDGTSFLPVLLGAADTHREYSYGVQTSRGIMHGPEAYGVRSVRDARWKYVRNLHAESAFQNLITQTDQGGFFDGWTQAGELGAARAELYRRRPAEELYDLEHDPYELVNLAQVEQHEGARARLAQELERWMQSQGDRGRVTELEAPPSRVPASER